MPAATYVMLSLFKGLSATRDKLRPVLDQVDSATALATLEESLLLADCGTSATNQIMTQVRAAVGKKFDMVQFATAVRKVTGSLLVNLQQPAHPWTTQPHVVLMVGTNGGGKTTTTAKLAHQAITAGKSVVLAAADTFRAAAVEQLQVLAERLANKVQVVTANDPGVAAYNAVSTAVQRGVDLVIIDTAGRQPTNQRLMAEASKIQRAVAKALPGAPHETLLTLDANTGQNALRQVAGFSAAVGLTGLVLSKLDSTARGGIVFAISCAHDLPIRYVGVGEQLDDLMAFDADSFTQALFAD